MHWLQILQGCQHRPAPDCVRWPTMTSVLFEPKHQKCFCQIQGKRPSDTGHPHLQLLHRRLSDTYISSLQLVFILQKQAIRRIHNVTFGEHIIPSIIYQTTKPLKLCDIIQLQSIIFMHKARNNSQDMSKGREREGEKLKVDTEL